MPPESQEDRPASVDGHVYLIVTHCLLLLLEPSLRPQVHSPRVWALSCTGYHTLPNHSCPTFPAAASSNVFDITGLYPGQECFTRVKSNSLAWLSSSSKLSLIALYFSRQVNVFFVCLPGHSVLLPHRWWLARSLPGSPTLYIFETRLPPFSSPDRSRWKGWDTRLPDPTMPTSCAHAGEQRLCSRIVLDAAHLCPFRVPLGAGSPPGSIPGQPAAVPARGNERRASLPAMGFSHFTSHSNSPNSRPSTEPPLTSRATLQTSAESGGKIKIRLM